MRTNIVHLGLDKAWHFRLRFSFSAELTIVKINKRNKGLINHRMIKTLPDVALIPLDATIDNKVFLILNEVYLDYQCPPSKKGQLGRLPIIPNKYPIPF